ncbi:MAG: antitoxin Xre/MbcA/ParS toxin-binding domain-containing protein [Bacteroidota bacterium]
MGKEEEPNKLAEPIVPYLARTSTMIDLSMVAAKDLESKKYNGKLLNRVQEETGLSLQDLASILGASKSKFYEMLKNQRLDVKSVDALADLASLWNHGLKALNDKSTLINWLQTPNPNLGGIKPHELLFTRVGRRELTDAFNRIEFSIYG